MFNYNNEQRINIKLHRHSGPAHVRKMNILLSLIHFVGNDENFNALYETVGDCDSLEVLRSGPFDLRG